MFSRVLIANRGEIACRIIQSCHKLGLTAIAVYSEADRYARHIELADEAWPIGESAPSQSYLSVDAILEAARRSRAEAIHPGYGFLSEQAEFARRVMHAGLVFVGPDPDTIEQMGSKRAAKALMETVGVPVVPGYAGDNQDPVFLAAQAQSIGFPLLIKAVHGGGGRGMRLVREIGELPAALESARREALASFGDGSLLLERYIETPRHIEVQILGDRHGRVVHLFERECTLQRRYQKVWEESPSSLPAGESREALLQAALHAARAVRYVGAGTVEFVVDRSGAFHFLEMNTRLQVEHPVTEFVTGLDLVALQFEIAAGHPIPFRQEDVRCEGHAIEVRLYAENPQKDFLPTAGRLDRLDLPDIIRVDTGYRTGDRVGTDYDTLIAKLIAQGPTRAACLAKLVRALAATWVAPLATNLPLLEGLARNPEVAQAHVDTGFITTHLAELILTPEPTLHHLAALAWATTRAWEIDDSSPWGVRDAFRIGHLPATLNFTGPRGPFALTIRSGQDPGSWHLGLDGVEHPVETRWLTPESLWVAVEGCARTGHARRLRNRLRIDFGTDAVDFETHFDDTRPTRPIEQDAGRLVSPFPGRIVKITVCANQAVAAGSPLVIIEGMKMEYTLRAPYPGRIRTVSCEEGAAVAMDQPLMELDPDLVTP
ncbi:MAG: acetyl/propionyl/methylcrotonyl-CoA carboxylase subunit alpha [Gammaproteobacteria bacterium]